MRMNESGKEQKPTQENLAEEEDPGKRDPSLDNFHKWLSLFIRADQARADEELSVYTRTIAELNVIADEKSCPMMAVRAQGGRHVLMYNPTWMQSVGYLEFVATLCHEALHILMWDIARALKRVALYDSKARGQIWSIINLALDAANNDDLVEKMPHMRYGSTGVWVLPENVSMRRKQDWEFYFEKFMQRRHELLEQIQAFLEKMENGEEDEEGERTPEEEAAYLGAKLILNNAHDWTGSDVEDMNPEEIEALASMLEQDAKKLSFDALKAHQKACGSVPKHFKALLELLEQEHFIHWSKLLARLLKARMLGKRKLTESRPSKKRYIMFDRAENGEMVRLEVPLPIYPGSKRDRKFVIMYAIDTSGSMSNMEVAEGLAEIQALLKSHPDTYCLVVQCDTHISDVTMLGPDMDVEEYCEKVGRTSAGGTTFDQPFRLVRAMFGLEDPPALPESLNFGELLKYKGVDLVIYHTDGYSGNPPITVKPPCPVVWVLTKGAALPWGGRPNFGTFLER
jgi:predicted metal-dependent peptidase